jgi:hypothetical protein
LAPKTRAFLQAYCAGFDAGAASRGWPFVLRLLGIPPARHRLEDVVSLYRMVSWFGLTSLVELGKMLIAELAACGDSRATIALLLGHAATEADLNAAPMQWPPAFAPLGATPAAGSNAIAVAGARSASGGALLPEDPHMEVARIPPVLYASHTEHPDGTWLQGLFVPGGVVVSANECPPGCARRVPFQESRYRHKRLDELTKPDRWISTISHASPATRSTSAPVGSSRRVQERLDEEVGDRLGVVHHLPVARIGGRVRRRQLEAVQGARAGQRLLRGLRLADDRGQERVIS